MARHSSAEPSQTPGRTSPGLRLLATGAGVGDVPVAPGTVGSLLGAALCLPLLILPESAYLGATIGLTAVAIWAAGGMAAEVGEADPAPVVIDEIVGMLWAAMALTPHLLDVAAVFLLFRLFDIVKPAPILWLERLPGGLGIVADDVAAGLLARATWWLLKVNFDLP
ncbi:MAG TPA: phosphatidylglycerophosphatase A [Candidatus Acidoferrum sp.]|nr:phosphatidylglycerophosphatase A [Candidatus Acidoferrum sp.]